MLWGAALRVRASHLRWTSASKLTPEGWEKEDGQAEGRETELQAKGPGSTRPKDSKGHLARCILGGSKPWMEEGERGHRAGKAAGGQSSG